MDVRSNILLTLLEEYLIMTLREPSQALWERSLLVGLGCLGFIQCYIGEETDGKGAHLFIHSTHRNIHKARLTPLQKTPGSFSIIRVYKLILIVGE